MARAPQVTRTIQTTHCNVMCLDITAGEPCNKEVVLPRTYKDEQAMLRAVKKVIETDELKAVHIVDHCVQETLYGMSEQDFIEHATVLPPRKDHTNTENENTTEG